MTESTLTAAPAAPASSDPSPARRLPPNLENGFGGVDATKPIFSQGAVRASLFDLTGHGTVKRLVSWGEKERQSFELDVPKFLEFHWDSANESLTVAGETKASFQHNLTSTVTSGFSIAGFGAEFSETFSESHLEETYEKYAAHYEREQIYFAEMRGNAARYLSDEAAQDFETLEPAQLVDKYGTHYMVSVTFGGLKVFSTRVDVRDQVDTTKLETAMKLSVKATDPESGQSAEGSAGSSNSDETIRKLHEKMVVTRGRTRGGQAGLPRAGWIQSLYVNPSVIGYKLARLDDLAGASRKEALKAEIDRRLSAQRVIASATLLGMMVAVQPYTTDHGSGASKDLTVGRPRQFQDWYYVGQWGLPQRDAFPGGYHSLIFAIPPDADPANPPIKAATGFGRYWGKSSSYGLYRANAPSGYVAIGDVYESTDDAGRIGYVYFYGCLRADLVEDTVWTGELWNDHGSGARDDGSAFGFENNDARMLQSPGGPQQARMFKVASGYSQPGETPKRPKLASVKMLTDSWL